MACIERLGCVQIDSISVGRPLAAAVLASRCGRLPADAHRRAAARAGGCSSTGRTRRACCRRSDEPLLPRDKRASRRVPSLVRADPPASTPSSPTRSWPRPRARRDLRARLRRGGQGLLGVDAGEARVRRAVDGGRARDRRAARAWSAATPCPSASSRPSVLAAHRADAPRRRGGMQVERCRARLAASPARRASPTTTASRASEARSPRRSRSSSASGVLERVRMRELGDAWLVPAEDADRAIAATTRPTGAFLLLARSTT